MQPSDESLREALVQRLARESDRGEVQPLAAYLAEFDALPESEVAACWRAARLLDESTEDGAEAASLEAGHRVGPYTLVRELGRGGQAAVWLAIGDSAQVEVALKLLRPGTGRSLELFRREAEVVARLEHPDVCRFLDSGTHGGLAWIAMQYVPGQTLATSLTSARLGSDEATLVVEPSPTTSAPEPRPESRTLPDEAAVMQTVRFVARCARALEACHEAGIIHRDVKPGNVMVTPDGAPVILDFGLARQEDDSGRTVTLTGELFGTPAYMSPEQLAVKRIRLDRRTDVYSLGATLYECLTLDRPFEAPTRDALYQAIMTKEAVSPRRINPAVPRDLVTVVARAMEKDRDRRYATAAALADDLEAVVARRPIAVKAPGPVERLARWARREPALAGLLLVLFVSLPVITTLFVKRALDAPRLERQRVLDLEERRDELLARANLAYDQGRRGEALRLYEEAHAMEGLSPEVASALIGIHNREGRPESALAIIRELPETLRACRSVRQSEARSRRALGDTAAADALLADMPPPTQTIDLLLMGSTLIEACEEEPPARSRDSARRAVSLLLRGIARLPRPRLSHSTNLAHAAGHAADAAAARIAIEALREHWPHFAVARDWAAFAAARSGLNDEALTEARAFVAIEKDDARGWALLGVSLSNANEVEEAVEALEHATALDPEDPQLRVYLARALVKLGKRRAAQAAFEKALELDPDHAESHAALAAFLTEGRLAVPDHIETALHHYRKAMVLAPWNAQNLANYGEVLRQMGEVAKAVEVLERAATLDPAMGLVHGNLGKALLTVGRLEDAEKAARHALTLGQDEATIHALLGEILIARGRLDAAISLLESADRRYPDDRFIVRQMGIALRRKGRTEDAHRTFVRSLALDPENPNPLCDLGLILTDLGRHDEARGFLERALSRRADLVAAISGLGFLDYHAGDQASCQERYRKAIALTPGNANFHQNLGRSLLLTGDFESAASSLREAARLDSENPGRWSDLGVAQSRAAKLDEALTAYDRAVALAPEDGRYHYARGTVLGRLGRADDAIAAYRAAIARDRDHPEAHCNLSLLLARRGAIEEATRLMRRGHALGSARAGWAYASDQWLADLEGRLKKKREVDDVIARRRRRPEGRALAELAREAARLARPMVAAPWFARAFEQAPELLRQPDGIRIEAARAALRAAEAWAARGEQAAEDPAAWRARALAWMTEELDALEARLEKRRLRERRFDALVTAWEEHEDLRSVRDEDRLRALPEAERQAWTTFWTRCADR